MTSEEETTIAFVFKRSGLSEISFSKFYLTLSMDLNWLTPEEAKRFTTLAIKHGLLVKKADNVAPSFDININIPIGFYPSKDFFKENKVIEKTVKTKGVLKNIVERISKETKLDEETILNKIKQIGKEKGITTEVAALHFCKENNIDSSDFFDDVENKIFQRK